MKTKHLNFEIFDCSNDWFSIFPLLGFKHKYWYLWSINFGWLCWDFILEITRRDAEFDDLKDEQYE